MSKLENLKKGRVKRYTGNDELKSVINSFPVIPNDNNLIFPSVRRGYIDQSLFSRRYWKPIILKLASNELIERYLPQYNLRHSYITRLIRLGVDVATVARICGTSPEMIVGHYLSPNDDYIPPNLGMAYQCNTDS